MSVQALVRLLEVFKLSDERRIRDHTLDAVAESFAAEVVGIVCNGSVIAAAGVGDDTTFLTAVAERGTGPRCHPDGPLGVTHSLCLPIENRPGTSFVVARAAAPFTGEESAIIRAMVRMMRLAVRTASAFADEHRTTQQLEAQIAANGELTKKLRDRHGSLMRRVTSIQRAVSTSSPHDETVGMIVNQARGVFGADPIAVRVHDGDRTDHWTANLSDEEVDRLRALPRDTGIEGRAIRQDALVADEAYRSLVVTSRPTMSAIAAPIHCLGQIVGSMVVLGGPDRIGPHDEEDQAALLILAGYVSVAITDASITQRLHRSLAEAEWRATHDHLTGLLNRERIVEIAAERIERGEDPLALYIDLDGFKTVNDLYGHSAGDTALVALASRLRDVIRFDESVARLAGDEFLALLPAMPYHDALAIARRVASAITAPLEVDGRQLALPPSIGIAGGGARSAEELLDAADLAMYSAKRSPAERIAFFDDGLRRRRTRRIQIEQRLRLAVSQMEGFVLHYQPIVADPAALICGFEALLRWDDGVLGSVSPDEFIPIAEDTGSITHIDKWVLERALAEIAVLDPHRSARVSVNLSAASFLLPNLRDLVVDALAVSATPAELLAIEITERVMLGDHAVVTMNIAALRDLGVAVVLDDFGTGYSSLSYLRSLEIDGLKIDRSFVAGADHDPRGEAILRSVVDLAERLGSQVIAEGVETTDQLELLRRLGCSRFQGYLFGRPLPARAGGAEDLRLPRVC